MGTGITSVRDAVQPSDGSDGETLPPPLSFRLLRTHFPYSLYIEQLPKALRGPSAPLAEPLPPSPWTKGVDLREDGGSTFVRGAKGRERGETAASFPHRAAAPVERGGRSGATASPFRRNGIVRKESMSGRQGRQSSAVRTIMDRGDRKNQDLNPTLRT